MTELTHPEMQLLLGAFALDAVDGDEAAMVEAHLAVCPRCRSEVARHREVATLLASGGGTAPPAIWDRIADSLEESPPALRPLGPERPTSRTWMTSALVAALVAVVLAVTAGARVVQQDRRIDELSASLRASAVSDAAANALADPDAQRVILRSTDGAPAATLVTTRTGAGYLLPMKLPALPAGRTYQLWALVGQAKISAAVLGASPGAIAFHWTGPVDGFAITEEDVPGSASPTRAPTLVGFVRA